MKREHVTVVRGTVPGKHRRIKRWDLKLFIVGASAKAAAAVQNLREVCDRQLQGHYNLVVIDLAKKPKLARQHQIVAVPTLLRSSPLPVRKIIGDLSNPEQLVQRLEL